MKKINYLYLTIITLLVACSTVSAKPFSHADIPENATIIGKAMYSSERPESSELYSGTVDTSAVMMGSSSVSTSSFSSKDSFVIYYKIYNADPDDPETYPEEWMNLIDNSSIDNANIPEEFDILYINGQCVDPSCMGDTISVTFKSNADLQNVFQTKNISVGYGEKITSSQLPVLNNRPGYRFKCWTLEGSNECYDFNNPITTDMISEGEDSVNFETSWEWITYNITYEGNFTGAARKERECQYGNVGKPCIFAEYSSLAIGNNSNYNFKGWSLSPNGDAAIYPEGSDMTSILGDNENVTLYARWERETYNVTYNLNGGTFTDANVKTSYTMEDGKLQLPDNPVRTGYTFVQWDYSGNKYNNQLVAGGMTLEAKWKANTYSFKYGNQADISCEYDKECRINITPNNVPAGRQFVRWYVNVDGNDIYLGDKVTNFTAENGKTFTLVPEYKLNNYTITYDYDGGKVDKDNVISVTYDSVNTANNTMITLNQPVKDGYTFSSWRVTVGSARVNGNNLTVTGAGNITIKAVYTENVYSVEYYNNGTIYKTTNNCRYTTCRTIPDTLTDADKVKTFDGWTTENGLAFGKDTKLVAVDTYATNKVIKLYAKWTNKYRHVVTYDLNGGKFAGDSSAQAVTSYIDGESITLPSVAKEGYVFKNWKVNGTVFNGTVLGGYTDDIKVEAEWTPIKYSVQYYVLDTDGRTNKLIGTDSCEYDSPCQLTKHSGKDVLGDENLEITGWSLVGVNDGIYYGDGLQVKNLTSSASNPVKLYVVYDDTTPYYNIITGLGYGHFNDGESIPASVRAGDTITLPTLAPNSDVNDKVFDGWKVNGVVTTDTTITVNEALYLEAVWAKAYKVTIDLGYGHFNEGESIPTLVKEGDAITLPTLVLNDDVKNQGFDGWKVDGVATTDTTITVNGDLSLESMWSIRYYVTLDLDGGTLNNQNNLIGKPYKEGDLINLDDYTPTKTGFYTFDSWQVDGVNVSGEYEITGDVTLTATYRRGW